MPAARRQALPGQVKSKPRCGGVFRDISVFLAAQLAQQSFAH